MHSRTRRSPFVAVVVAGLVLAACGGGSPTYEEGTPAATGEAPDCSVVPLELARKTLGYDDLQGPVAEPKADGQGWVCTFSRPGRGVTSVDQVQLTGNATEETFAVQREAYKANNNKVNNIKGWGDEAYATTVHFFSRSNNFAVRKGRVSVHITSTADYDNIQDLMKAILEQI